MKNANQLGVSFYQNLGKLLYAIAASDKNVTNDEFDTFKTLVQKEMRENIENEYSTYAIYQAEISFDYFNFKKYDADKCFEDFVNFKRENEHLFTNALKEIIMDAANSIASSFSGKNKSELIMLAKLELEFKK